MILLKDVDNGEKKIKVNEALLELNKQKLKSKSNQNQGLNFTTLIISDEKLKCNQARCY